MPSERRGALEGCVHGCKKRDLGNASRSPPPRLAALSIVGAIERLVWAWSQDEIDLRRREIAQQMADLFWRGMARG